MKKNVFLYVVIAVLAVALVGLGALNDRCLLYTSPSPRDS